MSAVLDFDTSLNHNQRALRLSDASGQRSYRPDLTRIVSFVLGSSANFSVETESSSQPVTGDPLISHYLKLRERFEKLETEDYDDEFLAPSDDTYVRAWAFMRVALKSFELKLPVPNFAPDGEGGIRIEWVNNARELRLICPSGESRAPYLYYEEADEYGVDEQVTDAKLLERLRWLIEATGHLRHE